jgi:hypothetical protein
MSIDWASVSWGYVALLSGPRESGANIEVLSLTVHEGLVSSGYKWLRPSPQGVTDKGQTSNRLTFSFRNSNSSSCAVPIL